jgi:lysophospholipase L1-like esterase
MSETPAKEGAEPRSGARRLAGILLANLAGLAVLFLLAEWAVRWHVEGGPLRGLASFVTRPAPPSVEPEDGTIAFLPDAELGYRLNPAAPGIGEHGFRHGPVQVPPPEGTARVLVIGDSVAWDEGGFVDMSAELLARSGSPIEVLNASVPGFTTYQERLFLESGLLELEPELVLLQVCLNDNHRFLHRVDERGERLFTPEAKRALIPEGGGPFGAFSRWSYVMVEVRRRLFARRLESTSPFPWDAREDFAPAWTRPDRWAEQSEHLAAMRDASAAAGAGFAVVVVPYAPQLDPELLELDADYVRLPQTRWAELAHDAGVPLLDLFDPFLEVGRDGLFTDGIHLTPRGHALAARELAPFVRELLGSR